MEPIVIDLLLIGKSGNGTSETGNIILGQRAFRSNCNSLSVTQENAIGEREFNDRVIRVVDTPGLCNTELSRNEDILFALANIEQSFATNPRGFHAFLIVFRAYVIRSSDIDVITFLKEIFGDQFFRHFCILVITCADVIRGQSIQTWCSEQCSAFKDLINECNNRVLLFDNKTDDEGKLNSQVAKLIRMVDCLVVQRSRYTDQSFSQTMQTREKIVIEAKKYKIREEVRHEIDQLSSAVIEVLRDDDRQNVIPRLQELLERINNLLDSIALRDRGTNILRDLSEEITRLKERVNVEIDLESTIRRRN